MIRGATTPTPTIVCGQVLPPAFTTLSITKALTPKIPSAGMAIFKKELFSEPLPRERLFGILDVMSFAAESSFQHYRIVYAHPDLVLLQTPAA